MAKAWVLLSIFVTTMALSVAHRHEVAANPAADCAECAHHVHHSHLSAGSAYLHDCLLCKFISLNYVAATAVALALPAIHASATRRRQLQPLCSRISGSQCTRAPPCFGKI